MKCTVYIATTLDGMIATPSGDVSFLNDYPPPEGNDMGWSAFLASVDVIVMGRKTFDKVVSFGPEMWAYGSIPVVVWSRNVNTVSIPPHLKESVTCSSLAPQQLVTELQVKFNYQHAYIDGGTTIREFLTAELIDTMILTRIPLVLGDGIPLFQGQRIVLDHEMTEAFSNGLVSSTYTVQRKTD
jgi:dihydrofolate reductase